MRRRTLAAIAGGMLAAVILCLAIWGPALLRVVPFFRVTEVSVSGARLMAPDAAYAALRIDDRRSVWDDFEPELVRLRANPAIRDARVSRRLPGRLTLVVVEERPVALIRQAGVLLPVTTAGQVVPVRSSRLAPDLPIAHLPDDDPDALLQAIGRLDRLDPGLLSQVSEISRPAPDELRLTLTSAATAVILPVPFAETDLSRARAVLADMGTARGRRTSATTGPKEIDLRFGDQAVVRSPFPVPPS